MTCFHNYISQASRAEAKVKIKSRELDLMERKIEIDTKKAELDTQKSEVELNILQL